VSALRDDPRWRMISQTAEYALRVVLHLSAQPAGRQTSVIEAASAVDVPERYLARVMNALAHAGVLVSTRGAQGGFRLAHAPGELTLAAVVAPFDAVGDAPQCLLRDQVCTESDSCIAHHHWRDVASGVRTFFQTTTIADLVEPAVLPGATTGLLMQPEFHVERQSG
jgi:Rrf2 family protein